MSRPSTHFLVSAAVLILVVFLVIGVRIWLASPPDAFADHAPPPSANARPDRPNPEKAKKLPGARRPG